MTGLPTGASASFNPASATTTSTLTITTAATTSTGNYPLVISGVSGDVLTVSTQAGELKVRLTDTTAIRRAVTGKAGDLASGDTVSVRLDPAAPNSGDGTVTASSVTEEPAQ